MKTYYRRCKHCCIEYRFRINGHRWGLEDYTSDYCPECQKAIDDALGKIPVKYEDRWCEIDNSQIPEFVEWAKSQNHQEINLSIYRYSYIITRGRNKYSINFDNNGVWKLYQWRYYDLINDKFTDDSVDVAESDYVMKVTVFTQDDVLVKPMNEPIGKIFYLGMKFVNDGDKQHRQLNN